MNLRKYSGELSTFINDHGSEDEHIFKGSFYQPQRGLGATAFYDRNYYTHLSHHSGGCFNNHVCPVCQKKPISLLTKFLGAPYSRYSPQKVKKTVNAEMQTEKENIPAHHPPAQQMRAPLNFQPQPQQIRYQNYPVYNQQPIYYHHQQQQQPVYHYQHSQPVYHHQQQHQHPQSQQVIIQNGQNRPPVVVRSSFRIPTQSSCQIVSPEKQSTPLKVSRPQKISLTVPDMSFISHGDERSSHTQSEEKSPHSRRKSTHKGINLTGSRLSVDSKSEKPTPITHTQSLMVHNPNRQFNYKPRKGSRMFASTDSLFEGHAADKSIETAVESTPTHNMLVSNLENSQNNIARNFTTSETYSEKRAVAKSSVVKKSNFVQQKRESQFKAIEGIHRNSTIEEEENSFSSND